MNCKYCRANCTGAKHDRELALCSGYDPPKTNGDWIRAMTDEELADFLNETNNYLCDFIMNKRCKNDTKCSDCWLEWLRHGAENVNSR